MPEPVIAELIKITGNIKFMRGLGLHVYFTPTTWTHWCQPSCSMSLSCARIFDFPKKRREEEMEVCESMIRLFWQVIYPRVSTREYIPGNLDTLTSHERFVPQLNFLSLYESFESKLRFDQCL